MSLMSFEMSGFSFLLLPISLLVPRDPQQTGLSALTYAVILGAGLNSLFLSVRLSLYDLASLRARRIPRWGAVVLIALGLL